MGVFITFLLVIVGISVAIKVIIEAQSAKESARLRKLMLLRTKAFIDKVMEEKRLRPVSVQNLGLRDQEKPYWTSSAKLVETRAVRERGTSSQKWQEIDRGNLHVTNQRIVFAGLNQQRNLELKKIVSFEPFARDSVKVAVDNRQKAMIFELDDPGIMTVIVKICMNATELDALETDKMDFKYLTTDFGEPPDVGLL